jgi:hypothetical protein
MRTHWTRDKLELMDGAVLAALCKEANEEPSVSPLVAEQTHGLKLEWAALIRKITPPLLNPREEEKGEAAIEQVRMRMVELLASI